MTNRKSTKRALIASVISLMLCFTMLLGTTYAWFTDSVTSTNNIIKSGNLDVELYWSTNATDWTEVNANTNVFTSNLWEPGHTEVVYLKVVNAGSLALKYQLGVNVADEVGSVNVNGEEFKLSEFIKYGVVDYTTTYTRDTAIAAVDATATKLNVAYSSEITKLLPLTDNNTDNEDIVTMVVYMPTTVGNDANHAKGAAVPTIKLGINLFATQVEDENDSFGTDYDKDAPIVSAPIARPDSEVILKGAEDVMIALSDELLAALPADVTEIGMSVSEPVVDTMANTITFATIELVDQNGDVIDLASLNTKITVTLPKQDVFAVGETVVLYHDGEYVATAVVNGDKTISYEVEHLCEVTVGAVEVPAVNNNVVEISTAAQLFGFAQSVNAGTTYEGVNVVLTKDIDLKNAAWTPIGSATADHGFMGNFDGNGKTISNLSIKNIALTGGYAYAGLFGVTEGTADKENVIENLTIKNVTIATTGHIVSAAIAYPYYTTVKNITVCGDIAIKGGDYTSGVLAYTRRCVNASNLTVNGNEGSSITGATTVGGVISDIQLNGGLTADYSNFSASNITVTGNKCVGGISGIIGGQTLNGATVKNVNIVSSDAHAGIVSGSYDNKPVINNVKYDNVTGATAIAGVPYNRTESNGLVTVDGVEYAGNAETFKAQLANGTVNLACDIVLNEKITVANGKNVVINLNGNTISGTFDGTGNKEMFLVKGNLTVKNGSIEMTATQNQEWNAMAAIFDVTAGGALELDGVNATVGGTDMNFIVHLNNWGSATAVINNCDFNLSYVAVRAFNSGYDMNTVTIKNTDVTGGARLFWVHNYTAEGKGDSTLTLDIYSNNNTSEHEKPVRFGFSNSTYYDLDGKQFVTATTLSEVMAYAKNGNVIIDAQGANLGDYYYDGVFGDGTVLKNAKFTYVYGASVNGVATFENCQFVSDHSYSANFSDGPYTGKVIFNNCYFDGWSSFGDAISGVEMNNCTFDWNNPYSMLRFYQNAELNNCTFIKIDGIDTNKTGTVVKLNNCTGIEGKIYNNGSCVGTWIVDGTDISDTITSW